MKTLRADVFALTFAFLPAALLASTVMDCAGKPLFYHYALTFVIISMLLFGILGVVGLRLYSRWHAWHRAELARRAALTLHEQLVQTWWQRISLSIRSVIFPE